MQVLEQKEVVVGQNNYLITALDATYGLSVLNALMTMESSPPANFVKEVVLRSVKVNNIQPTEQWFNKHFARNYKELYELFSQIVNFNFDFDMDSEGESPNVESDTSET
jgi:hypothetical protein